MVDEEEAKDEAKDEDVVVEGAMVEDAEGAGVAVVAAVAVDSRIMREEDERATGGVAATTMMMPATLLEITTIATVVVITMAMGVGRIRMLPLTGEATISLTMMTMTRTMATTTTMAGMTSTTGETMTEERHHDPSVPAAVGIWLLRKKTPSNHPR